MITLVSVLQQLIEKSSKCNFCVLHPSCYYALQLCRIFLLGIKVIEYSHKSGIILISDS